MRLYRDPERVVLSKPRLAPHQSPSSDFIERQRINRQCAQTGGGESAPGDGRQSTQATSRGQLYPGTVQVSPGLRAADRE